MAGWWLGDTLDRAVHGRGGLHARLRARRAGAAVGAGCGAVHHPRLVRQPVVGHVREDRRLRRDLLGVGVAPRSVYLPAGGAAPSVRPGWRPRSDRRLTWRSVFPPRRVTPPLTRWWTGPTAARAPARFRSAPAPSRPALTPRRRAFCW